jgi:hypothetical protein
VRGVPIDITGRRFGSVKVIRWDGWLGHHKAWLVRCDCGKEWRTRSQALREGDTRRCSDCRDQRFREYGKAALSVRVYNGKTLAQIADAAGLTLNTVYRRWLRGWPVARLGDPLRVGGVARGSALGGRADLPERRCTMFPERRA